MHQESKACGARLTGTGTGIGIGIARLDGGILTGAIDRLAGLHGQYRGLGLVAEPGGEGLGGIAHLRARLRGTRLGGDVLRVCRLGLLGTIQALCRCAGRLGHGIHHHAHAWLTADSLAFCIA